LLGASAVKDHLIVRVEGWYGAGVSGWRGAFWM